MEHKNCKFKLVLSECENESMKWLDRVLRKMAENPKSNNRLKAASAEIALVKIRKHLFEMHAAAHILEIQAADAAVTRAEDALFVNKAKDSSTEGLN